MARYYSPEKYDNMIRDHENTIQQLKKEKEEARKVYIKTQPTVYVVCNKANFGDYYNTEKTAQICIFDTFDDAAIHAATIGGVISSVILNDTTGTRIIIEKGERRKGMCD